MPKRPTKILNQAEMPGVPLGSTLTMPQTEAPAITNRPPLPPPQIPPGPPMQHTMPLRGGPAPMPMKRPMKHKVRMNPGMFQQNQPMPTLNK